MLKKNGHVSASWRQQPVVAKKESCFEDIRLFVIKVRIFHDNMISAVVLSHFPREWAFCIVSVENIVISRWSEQLNSAEKKFLPTYPSSDFNFPVFPFIDGSYYDKMSKYKQTELQGNQMQDQAAKSTLPTMIFHISNDKVLGPAFRH